MIGEEVITVHSSFQHESHPFAHFDAAIVLAHSTTTLTTCPCPTLSSNRAVGSLSQVMRLLTCPADTESSQSERCGFGTNFAFPSIRPRGLPSCETQVLMAMDSLLLSNQVPIFLVSPLWDSKRVEPAFFSTHARLHHVSPPPRVNPPLLFPSDLTSLPSPPSIHSFVTPFIDHQPKPRLRTDSIPPSKTMHMSPRAPPFHPHPQLSNTDPAFPASLGFGNPTPKHWDRAPPPEPLTSTPHTPSTNSSQPYPAKI